MPASGSMDDLAKASALAVQLAGAARAEATVSHFLSVVRRMLAGRRERLEAVASTLVQVGVLEREELVDRLPRSPD